MPHAWALVESSFPTLTDDQNTTEKLTALIDYMKILTEALQYQLENLDADNWNVTALEEFQADTTQDVTDQVERMARQITVIVNEIIAIEKRLVAAEALTGRMTAAETEIAYLQRDMEAVRTDVDDLMNTSDPGILEDLLDRVAELENGLIYPVADTGGNT